jgi:uncharacterized cupin superfamily protein
MPKIDVTAVQQRKGTLYPPQFNAPCAERVRQRLGDAGGLTDFGVNLTRPPPGTWSSLRHWHSDEDEFVYVLEGELTFRRWQRNCAARRRLRRLCEKLRQLPSHARQI